MDLLVTFFRDTISGVWYFVYIAICILLIFVTLGFVGDRKRAIIFERLQEKRKQDIESGKAFEIAARESKQILDVMSEEELKEGSAPLKTEDTNSPSATENLVKKEEAPKVLVLGEESSNAGTTSIPSAPATTPVVNDTTGTGN